ncbi:MAG: hypothetical protein JETT_1382 [Candidatus Jettenia ecosi]|uniref:Uncharacterized protein n=1 Tax=Candidatus Jettenia ecosi TaxID=2494326 RepID=A0A533QP63_9BACT|nr:MAG: hypothetical protein JETT_1382 [Candidatus Jettenia ecosi]
MKLPLAYSAVYLAFTFSPYPITLLDSPYPYHISTTMYAITY